MAFFGVNFILQKFCPCKKNDKYKVWLRRTFLILTWPTSAGHCYWFDLNVFFDTDLMRSGQQDWRQCVTIYDGQASLVLFGHILHKCILRWSNISWFYSFWLPAGGFEFDSYPNKNSKLVHFQEYEPLYFFWPLINNFVKNLKEPLMVLTPVPDCLQIIEILRPVGLLPKLGLPFNKPYCTWISHEDHK